jgi:hypothetical protein
VKLGVKVQLHRNRENQVSDREERKVRVREEFLGENHFICGFCVF